MRLRAIANWLRAPGSRHWTVTVCAVVVLLSSGIPCAAVCLAHDAGAPAQEAGLASQRGDAKDADADHCGDQDHCPSPSICSTDQAPATAIESPWHAPTFEPLSAWPSAPHQQVSPLQPAAGLVAPGAARSSPSPPTFSILRL